eukprot:4007618-Prymnesium_polylepis.1
MSSGEEDEESDDDFIDRDDEDEDEAEERARRKARRQQRRQRKTQKAVDEQFDFDTRAQHYKTSDDDRLRATDLPERFQLWYQQWRALTPPLGIPARLGPSTPG